MLTNITALELWLMVLLLLVEKGQCGGGRNYLYGNEPEFTEPLKNITVQMGRNATFTCHISGIENKGFRVGWVKADTKAIQAIGNHVITHNPRIMVRHQNRVKHQLIIVNATLEEDGPYMCQLNTQPMKSQIGFLTVYKKADIIRVSGAEGVNEGGEARLKCEAEGYPTPTVYWTRAEKDVPIILKDRNGGNKREVRRVKNDTLVLSKISRSQMGNYLCIASNRYSPLVSHSIMVNINFRPVIIVETPIVSGRVGQEEPVVLECLIEAYPKGIHFWEHVRAGILSEGNGKYSIAKFDIGQYKTRFQLTINDFNLQDVGNYKCICNNQISSRVEGDVKVRIKPELPPSTTAESEYFINAYTDYGDYVQHGFEYRDGIHRSKEPTTFVMNGRTPPTYDISVNGRDNGRISKGGSSNTYYSTTNIRRNNGNLEDDKEANNRFGGRRSRKRPRKNKNYMDKSNGEQIASFNNKKENLGFNNANKDSHLLKICTAHTTNLGFAFLNTLLFTYLTN